MKEEIYFSTDVESDGPIPGPNSMLSFSSVAFSAAGEILSTFSANLNTIPGATPDPNTMEWWKGQPEAWEACRKDLQDPSAAMKNYIEWVKQVSGDKLPVFVAYPAAFDFMYVYWYMIKFAGESPFSFSALDMKSYAMALMKCGFRQSTKRNFPKKWKVKYKHTHIALEDAVEQGNTFIKMLNDNTNSFLHEIDKEKIEKNNEAFLKGQTK